MKVLVRREEIRTSEWTVDVPAGIEEQFGEDVDGIRNRAFERAMERDEDKSRFREYGDWFETEVLR